MPLPERIVSGGQTGVDRAALDAAMVAGLACGGWCPAGRRAEDGTIPRRYRLQETSTQDYGERTRFNVRDSDATLIVCFGPPRGGTGLTAALARDLGRPLLITAPTGGDALPPQRVAQWIAGHRVSVLNIAGPRESEHPGIHDLARGFLGAVLAACLRRSGSA